MICKNFLSLTFLCCLLTFWVTDGASANVSLNDDEDLVEQPSRSASDDQNPLTKAIEIMEFVSTFSSTIKGFGGGTQTAEILTKISRHNSTDPLTLLTSVVIFGAVRVGSVLLSTFLYLFSALMTPLMGTQFDLDSISYQLPDHYQKLDYNIISESIRSVPEHSFRLFDIKEQECQSRAMCEGGEFVSRLFPAIANWVRMIAATMDLKDRNTKAVLRGIGWADCGSSFKSCPKSPFKKLHRIWNTFSKMY